MHARGLWLPLAGLFAPGNNVGFLNQAWLRYAEIIHGRYADGDLRMRHHASHAATGQALTAPVGELLMPLARGACGVMWLPQCTSKR